MIRPSSLGLVAFAAVIGSLAVGTFAPAAHAQEYAGVVVQADPRSTVVAATIRYPVGSAMDPDGEEGTAFLLGRALEAEAARRLRARATRVEVTVGRRESFVTLLAPPEEWAEAFRVTEGLLSSLPMSEGELTELRDRHLGTLLFEEGAPVRSFERERLRLVHGAGDSASRSIAGTAATVARVTPAGIARFQAEHLVRGRATVALVGAVTEAEVSTTVRGPRRSAYPISPFQESGVALPVSVPADRSALAEGGADTLTVVRAELPPGPRLRLRELPMQPLEFPSPGSPAAWSSPDRIAIDRELTSTWIAVAWPYADGTPHLLLDLLGRTLHETIVPSPPGPGFYAAEYTVQEADGRPVLVFSATMDPRVAAGWEERILEGMAAVAASPPDGAFFELGRRRFRNSVLLPMSAPEVRSHWLARELAERGSIPDLEGEIWRITREDLGRAAEAAGPPRVLVLGPLGMIEAGRR